MSSSNHSSFSSSSSSAMTDSSSEFSLACEMRQKNKFQSFRYEDHFECGTSSSATTSRQQEDQRSRLETHYTQALCMALGAGADQTKEQSSWLKGFLVTKAYPSVLIESVDTLLEQVGELSEEEFLEDCHLLAPTFATTAANRRCHHSRHQQQQGHNSNNRMALSVVYDMMQGAAVSGFSSPAQTRAIATLAKAWSINAFDLEEIRYQVAVEEQQRRQRLERLFPRVRNIDHMLMMPRIETHMYLAHIKKHQQNNCPRLVTVGPSAATTR